MKTATIFFKLILSSVLLFVLVSIGMYLQKQLQQNNSSPTPTPVTFLNSEESKIATNSDVQFSGKTNLEGDVYFDANKISYGDWTGRVLSLDKSGKLVLVPDHEGSGHTYSYTTNTVTGDSLPSATESGSMAYYDGSNWQASYNLFNGGGDIGIGTTNPQSALHILNNEADKIAFIVQGYSGQTSSLTEWQNADGVSVASINPQGKLTIGSSGNDHSIELTPTGNSGYLSSSGGVIFINNTSNTGTGIGIYSNAGEEALGNMINVKVDNANYSQAAFYMDYDGSSNAVEIVSNSTDTSSNALAVTGNNPNDSTLGIIGYETGRGTVKISHNGTGSDSNASGISIDLKGTGTRAQGLYIDSTATGGTAGNLLRLRNQTVDRFVVDKNGSLSLGGYGTDTSITKYGNTTGDQFFVGTNGAFRIQRSATDSEAFRTQVNGDTQGRWLGTSDGKLKFGSGSLAQDVVMQRISVGTLQVDPNFTVTSNLGIGATTFDSTGDNVLTLTNGTAPGASVTDSVQLYASDVASSSELRVRDEAGNITTLSPHNFTLIPNGASENLAWSYYSEKENMAINVDLLKVIRTVENLSGTQLVYEKNLSTGQMLTNDSGLTNIVTNAFNKAVSKEDFSKYVALKPSLWQFLGNVLFKAKATFENTAEFLADAVFKGAVTVNADTAGVITVPEGTSHFSVTFEKNYVKKPIVYVTPHDSPIKFSIQNIQTSGFEVLLESPLSKPTDFSWLALISEDNTFAHLKVLESTDNSSITVSAEASPKPSPTTFSSSPSAELKTEEVSTDSAHIE